MYGFAVGSLVLIALYVAGRDRGATRAAAAGGNWLISGLRRAISPDVAGVPQLRRVTGRGRAIPRDGDG